MRLVRVVATIGQGRPVLEQVAILSETADTLQVVNPDLDDWRAPSGVRATIDAAQDMFRKPTRPITPPPNPLRDLATRAIDAAVTFAGGTVANDISALIEGCESAGLLTLGNALDQMAKTRDISPHCERPISPTRFAPG